jgi:small subunit ribosomal protein S8
MSMTDPVADLLTRIRNAVGARKEKVDVPHSRLKEWWTS